MKRVLVCGGRDYGDASRLRLVLNQLDIGVLIHGAARGADRLAAQWAADEGVEAEAYPADWKLDGRAAGFIRNRRMLAEGHPDLVVAFPGGRGTADMVAEARRQGVPVHVHNENGSLTIMETRAQDDG